jgi:hypothetical protein
MPKLLSLQKPLDAVEAAAALQVLDSVKTLTEDQNSSQNSNTALDVVRKTSREGLTGGNALNFCGSRHRGAYLRR